MKNFLTQHFNDSEDFDSIAFNKTWFYKTWIGRATFVFILLWVWFLLGYLLAFNSGEIPLFINIVNITGCIGYIFGLLWVCRGLVKTQRDTNAVHWIELYINRLFHIIAFGIIAGIACGVLYELVISQLNNTWNMSIFAIITIVPQLSVFLVMCILSALLGWFLSGQFIKQSLITEANIKANEMYTGKKRIKNYYEK